MTDEINLNPGLIEDPRTEEAKAKDYPHEEVAMAVPLKWNRGIESAPVYSDRDQDGSLSCVAQSGGTATETITGKVISAHPPYRRRNNYPNGGMWLQDLGQIYRNLGTTTEDLDPSQRMGEQQMNEDVKVETPIKGFLYAFPNVKNIDEIATAIETQKHCLITIYGSGEEYVNFKKPVVIPNTNLNISHCLCGIYYFTDENGVKCILVKESWGPNYIRQRIFTEDYLKARGTGAMYFIPVAPKPTPVKPKFTFQNVLLYGQSNYSIKMLQDILRYEGLFGGGNITSTGNYLTITAKGVYQWQVKHAVASMAELNSLQGRRVGLKTIAALNKIYS